MRQDEEASAAGGEGLDRSSGSDARLPSGAPPVRKPVGASWDDRPIEPSEEAAGVREDQPPAPEAVRRQEGWEGSLPPGTRGPAPDA